MLTVNMKLRASYRVIAVIDYLGCIYLYKHQYYFYLIFRKVSLEITIPVLKTFTKNTLKSTHCIFEIKIKLKGE